MPNRKTNHDINDVTNKQNDLTRTIVEVDFVKHRKSPGFIINVPKREPKKK